MPHAGAEAVLAPARHAVRAEAQVALPEPPGDARPGALRVHVPDRHLHADRRGARAAAQAGQVGHVREVELVDAPQVDLARMPL